MEKSNLLFAKHFASLRTNPKWGLKLILAIVVAVLTAVISTFTVDYSKISQGTDMSSAQSKQIETMTKIMGLIGGSIGAIIMIGVIFLIFLVIAKIMKSDASGKSIFSATLSYKLITGIVALVVILIQWISGLSANDYNLTSLNIFDKGNPWLGVLDLKIVLGTYVFGIMLYATNRFSKKSSWIWTIAYLVISIGFGLIGASIQ
ncbi:YIP1 family protein [Staphylococcus epidermidis]|uniref:YIP1 family protein n=1 Tax=Staphylococcus epidermidis TaxID=1282 RepID=UPI0019D266A2|nr:YIP1 family protein [Staphylococcus epidermidis]MBN6837012.1 YIP1 family protein [Staphylococcus epidermidis]MCG1194417.1 YIP1 family protein [Staphylococcus epidermidis]MCG1702957.1 YIP1 family protein [Staphylococcus epidermidis]MCG2047061.1 YIP1 family protein [Staphylococcus epidermidis]MCG2186905.1 YIP1 family protein [Staphylococcus epidermidis]